METGLKWFHFSDQTYKARFSASSYHHHREHADHYLTVLATL